MNKNLIAIILINIIVTFTSEKLLSDVIVTKEGMVLNGKIIQKHKKIIIFSNQFGTFKIKKMLIKTIRETKKYVDDIRIMRSLGVNVNNEVVRKNYESGEKQKNKLLKKNLKHVKKVKKKKNDSTFGLIIYGSFFYNFNVGSHGDSMPGSLGALLTFDILFIKQVSNNNFFLIPELRFESSYYNSTSGNNSIEGFSVSLGPIWEHTWKLSSLFGLNLHFTSLHGFGYYYVKNNTSSRIKMCYVTSAILGLSIIIDRFYITPAFRYEYIYDALAPMHGLGLVISIGFRF